MPDRDPPTLYTEAAVARMESDKQRAPLRLVRGGRHRRDTLIELARKARAESGRCRESDGLPEPPEAA